MKITVSKRYRVQYDNEEEKEIACAFCDQIRDFFAIECDMNTSREHYRDAEVVEGRKVSDSKDIERRLGVVFEEGEGENETKLC